MNINQANRHLPPGAYAHDASEIARIGRNGTMLLGGLAVAGDVFQVASDVINDLPIQADLAYAGETAAVTVAGILIFHGLHKVFRARADELQNG